MRIFAAGTRKRETGLLGNKACRQGRQALGEDYTAMIYRLASAVVVFGLSIAAAVMPASAQTAFDAGRVSCGDFIGAQKTDSPNHEQYEHGRLWVLGYLAGHYTADGELEVTNRAAEVEPVHNLLHQMCQGFPDSSLLYVSMLTLATETLKLPAEPRPGFKTGSYTCSQHIEIKDEGEPGNADAAELWAFAFIQGYKNVEAPYIVIPTESMASLTAAIVKNCRDNPETLFQELTIDVAKAVRLDITG